MEHRKVKSVTEAYSANSDLDVFMSFCSAVACLSVLENLIREGATPTNIARQTGLMRHAVESARSELVRRGVPVPDIAVTACHREG